MLNTKNLTRNILIGMLLGIVVGLFSNAFYYTENATLQVFADAYLINGLFYIGGTIFISLLKLLIVPVVFVSLICGTYQLRNNSHVGRIAGKTVGFYLATTIFAISMAIVVGVVSNVGNTVELDNVLSIAEYTPPAAVSFTESFAHIIPDNIFDVLGQNTQLLQIIIIAVFFGLALTVTGSSGVRIAKFMEDLNAVILRLVFLLMLVAPYGVFFLVAKQVGEAGYGVIGNLAGFLVITIALMLFHGIVIYGLMLRFIGGLNPLIFFRKMYPVMIFAFSTSSSNATVPVTLDIVENKLGVKNSLASFAVPLGATINMNATAIMQGVVVVFIANIYNIDIGLMGFVTIVLMATIASIGTAGVPGIGMLTLAMVLSQVGIDPEAIAIVIGIDRLLDMIRTPVNVMGDAAVSCIVAKSEGIFDQEIYNA